LQYLAAPLRLDLRLGLELGAAARGGERRGPRYFYSIGYQGQF
jgi:hypothetical protein